MARRTPNMRIAQIVLPNASLYERKSQRIDFAALTAAGHEVEVCDLRSPIRAEVAHVYGTRALPRIKLSVPFVASGLPPRVWWRRKPDFVVAPVEEEPFTLLPEAVEDVYFDVRASGSDLGSIARPSVANAIDQTLHRLARTRDDIVWHLFDTAPTAEELSRIGVWVDPASDAHDYDGYTAEALAAGCTVVATRTPINRQRCEEGRTALLVPPADPNEMTHAILSALFKSEVGQQRAAAAKQTIGKFRARQRLRVLAQMYERLLG